MHSWFESDAITEAYIKCRPDLPLEIKEKVLQFHQERSNNLSLMIDMGCGSGQCTKVFASSFDQIIGVDPSKNQIEKAKLNNFAANIKYMVGSDEDLPVDDGTVDLVFAGQAVHWFNFDKFYSECARVLKTDGCLVLFGYDRPNVSITEFSDKKTLSEVQVKSDLAVKKFLKKCLYDERSKHIEDHYSEIFSSLKSCEKSYADDFVMKKSSTLKSYFDLISSFSGYQNYVNCTFKILEKSLSKEKALEVFRKDYDIIESLRCSLREIWQVDAKDEEVKILISWSTFMIFSKKPNF